MQNNNIDKNLDTLIISIDTDEIETKKIDERKCAPGIKFEAGSCITLPVLIEMANAYNIVNTNKIKLNERVQFLFPIKYKKYLLKKIKDRYANVCDSQLCWIQQDFIKHMNQFMKEELEKYTLRPIGPTGRFDWLDTININEVMSQYEKKFKDFNFLGAVGIDFQEINLENIANLNLEDLYNKNITKIGIVFNFDESWQAGSHWVAVYGDTKKGFIYYYDSYGTPAPEKIIIFMKKFDDFYIKKFNKKIELKYNTTRHQYEYSECGVYSINFILQLLHGKKISYITDIKIKDKVINKLRKKIFRNVNFKTKLDPSNSDIKAEKLLEELL